MDADKDDLLKSLWALMQACKKYPIKVTIGGLERSYIPLAVGELNKRVLEIATHKALLLPILYHQANTVLEVRHDEHDANKVVQAMTDRIILIKNIFFPAIDIIKNSEDEQHIAEIAEKCVLGAKKLLEDYVND